MYGLNTPESDYDERYIFMNDSLSKIIGLERFDHIEGRSNDEDKFGFELRHYLTLLKKTNTQVVEIIYANEYIEIDPLFRKLVVENRHRLIDTERMFKSLSGYIQSERRLANGERTGELGGKRKAALDKYGFSPKNYVQLFRLTACGISFIEHQVFPTKVSEVYPDLAKWLMHLKTKPEDFKKEELNALVDAREQDLKNAFEKRDKSKDLKFDNDLANEILLEFYYTTLAKEYARIKQPCLLVS